MNTKIIINISYWNDEIEVENTKSLLTIFKDIDKPYSEIQKELRVIILKNKLDGFQFDIFEFSNHGVILIELFHGIDEQNKSINVDYIKDYFNVFKDIKHDVEMSKEHSFKNFISLSINENNNEIEQELKGLDVEMVIVKKYHVYERGAEDFAIEIICSVLSNVAVDIILTALKSKSKDAYRLIHSSNKNDRDISAIIKDYLHENHDISPTNLKIVTIISFDDYYYVEGLTTNEKIEIKWSKQNKVMDLKIIQFNETRI